MSDNPGSSGWLHLDRDVTEPFFGTGRTGTPWHLDPRNVPSRWYMLRARVGEWVQHLGRRIAP